MKCVSLTLALLVVEFISLACGQAPSYGKFRSDAVIFNFYDKESGESQLKYARASPRRREFGKEYSSLNLLLRTSPGTHDQYWGLTASYDGGKVFWNGYGREELYEYDAKTELLFVIAAHMTYGLENLAYDHVTKVLYWTDSIEKAVFATDENYEIFVRIHEEEVLKPNALAVHVAKRKLYFSVYSSEFSDIADSKLVVSDLDGGNVTTVLVFPDVIRVDGITIDYDEDKLYWTDRGLSGNAIVTSCDLDGGNKKSFFSSKTGYFIGIALYKQYVYVADILNTTSEYNIHVRFKNRPDRGGILKTSMMPRNVALFARDKSSSVPVPNECDGTKCEQVCLASYGGGHTCRCSEGYNSVDGRCLTETLEDEYLIVSDLGQEMLFQMQLTKDADRVKDIVAIPIHETKEKIGVLDMAIDLGTGELAWHNKESNMIVWGESKVFFKSFVGYMEIDPCTRTLYWNSEDAIYNWNPLGGAPETIYSLPLPATAQISRIALDFRRKHIYWIQYDEIEKTSSVWRVHMNGTAAEVVLEGLMSVVAIKVDHQLYTLNILKAKPGLLHTLPLDKLERIPSRRPGFALYTITDLSPYLTFRRGILHDLVVIDGMVYLVDREQSGVLRYSIAKGPSTMEKYGPWRFMYPITMTFYSKSYFEANIAILPACQSTTSTTTKTTPTTTATTTAIPTTTTATTTAIPTTTTATTTAIPATTTTTTITTPTIATATTSRAPVSSTVAVSTPNLALLTGIESLDELLSSLPDGESAEQCEALLKLPQADDPRIQNAYVWCSFITVLFPALPPDLIG